MNPMIIYAVVTALIFGSGWQVRAWYDGAKDAAVLAAEKETQRRMTELANAVATKTEDAIQGIKIENRTIYTTAAKEIIREPIYSQCLLPDGGLRNVNAARAGAAAGKPDNRVPSARATGP